MTHSFNPAADSLYASRRRFPWINLALFVVTCATTLLVGALLMEIYDPRTASLWEVLLNPSVVIRGLPFSLAIMTILLSHEMGHYLTCLHYRIDASLPYFIPFPNPVGTMGAFIRIRSPFPNRGSLLEVGVAGPIAGFVVSVIVLAISLHYSRVVPATHDEATILLGEPLILKLIGHAMGKVPPEGFDLYLHPVGFAAWFGFFATALNLIPSAQLDGGHITYALFRNFHGWISKIVAVAMVPLGIFYWPGWLVWLVILLVLRFRHPRTLNDELPLNRRQLILGYIGILLLILCFTAQPLHVS